MKELIDAVTQEEQNSYCEFWITSFSHNLENTIANSLRKVQVGDIVSVHDNKSETAVAPWKGRTITSRARWSSSKCSSKSQVGLFLQ